MKIRQTTVSVSVPYQLAQFMYGKVDIGESVDLDDGESETEVRKARFQVLRAEATEMARVMARGDTEPSIPVPPPLSGRPQRRFNR